MEDYKKHIQENRHLLDDQEPMEGHFQRFEERLDKVRIHSKRKYLYFSAIAASIILFLSMGWLLRKNNVTNENNTFTLQTYYQEKITEQLTSIECKLEKADPETRSQLEIDLEMLRIENEVFLKDMEKNEDEEVVSKYMKQHYQTNLRALNLINDKLGNYIKC